MTVRDLDALEKLADEATPGPWTSACIMMPAGNDRSPRLSVFNDRYHVAELNEWDRATADFIAAANPATIKALIAELKEARGLLETLDGHLGEDDGLWSDDSTVSGEWIGSDGIRRSLTFGLFRHIRAFLARNGKGEG